MFFPERSQLRLESAAALHCGNMTQQSPSGTREARPASARTSFESPAWTRGRPISPTARRCRYPKYSASLGGMQVTLSSPEPMSRSRVHQRLETRRARASSASGCGGQFSSNGRQCAKSDRTQRSCSGNLSPPSLRYFSKMLAFHTLEKDPSSISARFKSTVNRPCANAVPASPARPHSSAP